VILKQELAARSAVVAGLVAGLLVAAASLLLLLAGGVGLCTAVVMPVLFGLAVWLLRVSWIGVKRARRLRTLTELRTTVEPSSPEWNSFERAWLATTRLDKLARRTLPEPFASRLCEQVESTARDMYGLAGYASELTRRMKLIDGARLAAEATQLRARQATAGGDAAAAIERSLSAVSDTRAVLDRLASAREVALARLVADTHALEGLQARTLELGAVLKASPSPPPDALDGLTMELEGLRQGMSEAVDLSRNAIGNSARPAGPQSHRPVD
jgi:hypothetical protein